MSIQDSSLEPGRRHLSKDMAAGIELASKDLSSYNKQRKRLREPLVSPDSASASSSPEYFPPAHDEHSLTKESNTPFTSSDDNYKDEKPYKSHGTLQDLTTPPYSEHETAPDDTTRSQQPLELIEKFLERYPKPKYTAGHVHAKLAQPIILPQKRAETRSHSFIRAYAPSLEPCGISQDVFLDFLATLDKCTQSFPALDAMNLASEGLVSVPQHFSMLVSIAIQVFLTGAAKEVQNRTRTNSFLDRANMQIFMPRGLYCLIVTYTDNNDGNLAQPQEGTDIPCTTFPSAEDSKFCNNSSQVNGHTYPTAEMPASAPLVFPGLNRVASGQAEEPKHAKETMKRAQLYITDYYDKWAQARLTEKYADNKLAKRPKKAFTSRLGDSNNAMGGGSFRSLLTGGYITPPDIGRSRNSDYQRDGRRGSEELRKKMRDDDWDGLYGAYREDGYGSDKYPCERRQSDDSASYASPRDQPSYFQTQPPSLSQRIASKDQHLIRSDPVSVPTSGTKVTKAFRKVKQQPPIIQIQTPTTKQNPQ